MFHLSPINFHPRTPVALPQGNSAEQEAFSLDAFCLCIKSILSYSDVDYEALRGHLLRHVGDNSTFIQKDTLKAHLNHLMHYMEPETNTSKRIGIAQSLTEEIALCTNGFYNRASSLYQSLQENEGFDDWLHDIRFELVERAARRASSDVHTHNRYFTLAASYFGVNPLVLDDAYRGTITDATIYNDLAHAFNQSYKPLNILSILTQRFLKLLESLGINRLIAQKTYEQTVFDALIEKINVLFPNAQLDLATLIELNDEGIPVAINQAELKKSIYLELINRRYLIEDPRLRGPILKLISHTMSPNELIDLASHLFEFNYLLARDVFRYYPSLTTAEKITILKRIALRLSPTEINLMLIATHSFIESFHELCVHFPIILNSPILISLHTAYRQEEYYQYFLKFVLESRLFNLLGTQINQTYNVFNSLICYPSTFEFCLDYILQIPQHHLWRLVRQILPLGKNFIEHAFTQSAISTESLQRLCHALGRDKINTFCGEVLEASQMNDESRQHGRFFLDLSPSKLHLFIQLCQAVGFGHTFTELRFQNQQTMLHIAASKGSLASVQLLVANQDLLNHRDDEEHTALHQAVNRGHLEIVRTLIEHGANPNIQNSFNRTALHDAVALRHLGIIQYLLTHNARVDIYSGDGKTALHTAIEEASFPVIELFIRHDANLINQPTSEGNTPLHDAVNENDSEMVEFLLEHHADIEAQTTEGETALHLAVIQGQLAIVGYLLEKGARINACDKNDSTPLHCAVFGHKVKIAELLIQYGANTNLVDIEGNTPSDIAREEELPSLIHLLKESTQSSQRPTRPSLFNPAAAPSDDDDDELTQAKRHKP